MRRALMFGALVCLGLSSLVAVVYLTGHRAWSVLPKVYAQEEEGCSLATIKGRFSNSGDGWSLIHGAVPFAEVGVHTNDGAGNFSGSFTINAGGTTSTSTFTGTYTVATDCTGSSIIKESNGTVSHFSFVIADHGKQIRGVQTDPGVVWTVTETRQ